MPCFPPRSPHLVLLLFRPDGRWGAEAAWEALLAGGASDCEASLEWVTNHYRWVVWKLAAYDRKLQRGCEEATLTQENVMQQLRHRCARRLGLCSLCVAVLECVVWADRARAPRKR